METSDFHPWSSRYHIFFFSELLPQWANYAELFYPNWEYRTWFCCCSCLLTGQSFFFFFILFPLIWLISPFLPLSLNLIIIIITQSCLTLCDPRDYSPPGSSVHGVFQAGILEWVAISFSRKSSWHRGGICISCIGRRILYHRCLSQFSQPQNNPLITPCVCIHFYPC